MDCHYFDAGRCGSCTLITTDHAAQIESKRVSLEALVDAATPPSGAGLVWLDPLVSAEQGFRTKAKMVVGGTADAVTLGILDARGEGVDLSDCPLYGPEMREAFPAIAQFITRARLEPYHLETRTGELKYVIVTVSPAGMLMVRFVARSTEPLARMVKHLPWLLRRLPSVVVVTLNILAEHKAVLEGDREIVLTESDTLGMDLGAVPLRARPQSFVQTNTVVARALYQDVARWVDEVQASSLWDLYCGVGGFALHCVGPGRDVVGVESSEQAVLAARESAAQMVGAGVPGAELARFVAADATAWVLGRPPPDVVVVNPPRRGIGAELAAWLESSGVKRVAYSSCNAVSLARDLAEMPSLVPVRGRLLDMFPHTEHYEAVVLLERQRPGTVR